MSNDIRYPTPLPAPFDPSDPHGWEPEPPRRRFQDVLWKHVLLFLLTLATTTLAGVHHYRAFASDFSRTEIPPFSLLLLLQGAVPLELLLQGLWYSGSILAILGAHEMGHYVACRWHKVDASLPYFLPLPLPFTLGTGTLGAVIRIREAFPSRKVLFDIGVAGPIAGFVVLVAALFLGLRMSTLTPVPPDQTPLLYLGEPLLFQWAARLVFGTVAEGYTLNMHPMVFASWFGMLATALNLLPFGQFDGGHITYATLGRWSTAISIGTVAVAVCMTFFVPSWLVMTLMMLVMLVLLGPRHPRVIYEYERVGRTRLAVAVFALVILVLCFTPVPLRFTE